MTKRSAEITNKILSLPQPAPKLLLLLFPLMKTCSFTVKYLIVLYVSISMMYLSFISNVTNQKYLCCCQGLKLSGLFLLFNKTFIFSKHQNIWFFNISAVKHKATPPLFTLLCVCVFHISWGFFLKLCFPLSSYPAVGQHKAFILFLCCEQCRLSHSLLSTKNKKKKNNK